MRRASGRWNVGRCRASSLPARGRTLAISTAPHILIVKPSSLGDIVHTFPAVALFRQSAPDAVIDWVAADSLQQTAQLCPGGIRRIIVFPRKELHSLHLGCLRLLWRSLREENYDAIIDFQGLLRSALMARAAKAPLRIGFDAGYAREGAWHFYTHRVTLPPGLKKAHAAEKNLYLMREAMRLLELPGTDDAPAPDASPTLPDGWQESARRSFGSANPAFDCSSVPLIAIGASSRWPSKSWDTGFFAAVIDEALRLRPGLCFWFLGTPGEDAQRAQSVIGQCRPENRRRLFNLAGRTTIAEMTALIASSRAMLTNDSGPMHIAAALRVPCVALFGATSPELTGPYGPSGRHTVIRSCCPQAPCFKRQCPLAGRRQCHEGIVPADVAAALLKKLP